MRVLPGQEPSHVWVGWVTSGFHQHGPTFHPDKARTVTVTLGDESGKVQERWARSNEFPQLKYGLFCKDLFNIKLYIIFLMTLVL